MRAFLGASADRLVVVGDRSIALALVVMGVAAVVVGLGVGRIKANGGIEIGDGAVVVPFLVGNEAAIVVGQGELGRKLDGAIEIVDGAGVRSSLARQASPRLL